MDTFMTSKGIALPIFVAISLAVLLQAQCSGSETSLTTMVIFDRMNGYVINPDGSRNLEPAQPKPPVPSPPVGMKAVVPGFK